MSEKRTEPEKVNTMMQGTANENAAGIRRICKKI